ncbi:hypothetical protein [Aquabacterium sp.]|uniref:hypothetical protein n=1 Tax=Aquabacterium sp. TaxID=1872578 RepID=UPI0035B2B1CB
MFSKLTRSKRLSLFGFAVTAVALAGWGVAASRSDGAIERRPSPAAGATSLLGGASPSQLMSVSSGTTGTDSISAEAIKPAAPLSDEGFKSECVSPLRSERYAEAIEACQRYANDERLGGKAHAALAAIYSTRAYRDVTASVTHAERAAELGDARGKFMTAIQMLGGYSTRPFDLSFVRKMLEDAQRSGVAQAGMLLNRIADSEQCRKNKQTFTLLNAPVFCMFRPEISQVLIARGMSQRNADAQSWADIWRPGEVLPSSSQAELLYDRSPDDEMLRLAQFTYRFDPIAASDQLPLVVQALRQKYGAPSRSSSKELVAGSSMIWHAGTDVDITLTRLSDGSAELRYAQTPRASERESHLAREDQLSRQARIRRQQVAL